MSNATALNVVRKVTGTSHACTLPASVGREKMFLHTTTTVDIANDASNLGRTQDASSKYRFVHVRRAPCLPLCQTLGGTTNISRR